MITYEEAHRIFRYDEETGKLYWKIKKSGIIKEEAGSVTKANYITVGCGGKVYKTHRIIWLMNYGKFPTGERKCIDHIDGDGKNNRLNNLRVVSDGGNAKNRKKHSKNTSGVNGVSWNKPRNKWIVHISIGGIEKHIGLYATLEDAITAREEAIQEYCPNVYSERHGK